MNDGNDQDKLEINVKGKPHRWKKGQPSANPKGRPKNPNIQLFRAAVAEVEKEKNSTLFKRAVELAWDDPTLMAHILKKLVPDMLISETSHDITINIIDRYELPAATDGPDTLQPVKHTKQLKSGKHTD